jgi:hypothetical protein
MARGILHNVAVQHESDSRIRFGVPSAFTRPEEKSSAISQRSNPENRQASNRPSTRPPENTWNESRSAPQFVCTCSPTCE